MNSLTFEKPVLISGVDGVISFELNIDLTNVIQGVRVPHYIRFSCGKRLVFRVLRFYILVLKIGDNLI